MTLDEALQRLEALGDERTRAHNTRYGAGDNQFAVTSVLTALAGKRRLRNTMLTPFGRGFSSAGFADAAGR